MEGNGTTMKRVLITGVYGLIIDEVHRRLPADPEAYEAHGLSRRHHSSDRISEAAMIEEVVLRPQGGDL